MVQWAIVIPISLRPQQRVESYSLTWVSAGQRTQLNVVPLGCGNNGSS